MGSDFGLTRFRIRHTMILNHITLPVPIGSSTPCQSKLFHQFLNLISETERYLLYCHSLINHALQIRYGSHLRIFLPNDEDWDPHNRCNDHESGENLSPPGEGDLLVPILCHCTSNKSFVRFRDKNLLYATRRQNHDLNCDG